MAGAWHDAAGVRRRRSPADRRGLAALPADERERVRVLLTAHSLPRRVAERGARLPRPAARDAPSAVAAAAGLTADRWTFCWQSAGHEPGEWMKPDFADLMPSIGRAATRSVLVAPVQFLADHLEILYDVDIGAREQAEASGVAFHRIESLNADPGLIAALRRGGDRDDQFVRGGCIGPASGYDFGRR